MSITRCSADFFDRLVAPSDYQVMTETFESWLARAMGELRDEIDNSPETRALYERVRARLFGARAPEETIMHTTMFRLSSFRDFSSGRRAIAAAWAAASGNAGAYAPRHIADALSDGAGEERQADTLSRAVRVGTARALQEYEARCAGGPEPRGLSVEINSGLDSAMVWTSDSHEIRLEYASADADAEWVLLIRGPVGSPRIEAAARVAAEHYCEPIDQTQTWVYDQRDGDVAMVASMAA